MIGVVVPTVPGREAMLERALASVQGPGIVLRVERGHSTCGDAWNAGGAWLLDAHPALEWIMMFADDLIAGSRWAKAAVDTARTGEWLPAPELFLEDGSRDARVDDGPPGATPTFSRVPFLPAQLWAELMPMPSLHYWSDCWVGDRCQERGWRFMVVDGYAFVHLWAQPGRINDYEPDRVRYAADAYAHPYRDLEHRSRRAR